MRVGGQLWTDGAPAEPLIQYFTPAVRKERNRIRVEIYVFK